MCGETEGAVGGRGGEGLDVEMVGLGGGGWGDGGVRRDGLEARLDGGDDEGGVGGAEGGGRGGRGEGDA